MEPFTFDAPSSTKNCEMERNASIVASVTMNAGIFALPMSSPLKRPSPVPNSTATMNVANMLLVELNTSMDMTAVKTSIEPTERSMPPVMMTSPMPMAMSPIAEEWRRMFITPFQVVAPEVMMSQTIKTAMKMKTKL